MSKSSPTKKNGKKEDMTIPMGKKRSCTCYRRKRSREPSSSSSRLSLPLFFLDKASSLAIYSLFSCSSLSRPSQQSTTNVHSIPFFTTISSSLSTLSTLSNNSSSNLLSSSLLKSSSSYNHSTTTQLNLSQQFFVRVIILTKWKEVDLKRTRND